MSTAVALNTDTKHTNKTLNFLFFPPVLHLLDGAVATETTQTLLDEGEAQRAGTPMSPKEPQMDQINLVLDQMENSDINIYS